MAAQARFVRCPSCQWGTLADGYFCAYCGRPLRPGGPGGGQAQPQAQPQAQAPAQYSQGSPGASAAYQAPGQNPAYYNPQERGGSMNYYQSGAGGQRGPVRCPSCGANNDPWLTHCKQCTRPLMSSG